MFDSEAEATQCVIAQLRGQETVDRAARALRHMRGSISVAIGRTPSLGSLSEEEETDTK